MSLVVHRFHDLPSTQDEARRLVEAAEAGAGHIVVADSQTAGRCRFGRDWLSPVGGLYATFVVPRHPTIQIATGVAVLRALQHFGVGATLKWPNDLLVDGRKLAGILIETVGELALVGIGVNLEEAPLEPATSVRDAGGAVRRGELVLALGEEIASAQASEGILSIYRANLSTLGQSVRITLGDGGTISGKAFDVDETGRLLVETPNGIRTVSSGECVHLHS